MRTYTLFTSLCSSICRMQFNQVILIFCVCVCVCAAFRWWTSEECGLHYQKLRPLLLKKWIRKPYNGCFVWLGYSLWMCVFVCVRSRLICNDTMRLHFPRELYSWLCITLLTWPDSKMCGSITRDCLIEKSWKESAITLHRAQSLANQIAQFIPCHILFSLSISLSLSSSLSRSLPSVYIFFALLLASPLEYGNWAVCRCSSSALNRFYSILAFIWSRQHFVNIWIRLKEHFPQMFECYAPSSLDRLTDRLTYYSRIEH